jgi:hypothetical protein
VLGNDVLIAIENGAPTYGVHPHVAYLNEVITGKIVFVFLSLKYLPYYFYLPPKLYIV